ncbi:MAG TPA: acyl-CoA thioesterase domain-containing protein [Ilumatobacter sp.]|nr:acyl-CoA thioesterase domain-containing protein [Ilumatobacter sp.]
MFELVAHGPDTYVGTGPQYPWGGLYGGQIVAQALRAATLSVEPAFAPHSIRAYFIRRGDHNEPVRYEVDRIRNGRSFVTRRVVARQAVGAILNAECSFQRPEESPAVQTVTMPVVPAPDGLPNVSSSVHFERREVPAGALDVARDGAGRAAVWFRATADLAGASQVLHECWLAYISDDLPTEVVFNALWPDRLPGDSWDAVMSVSLDHTVWFHRPLRADEWHLYDMSCHFVGGSRGLAFGHVFTAAGEHVASLAQEVLVRTGS